MLNIKINEKGETIFDINGQILVSNMDKADNQYGVEVFLNEKTQKEEVESVLSSKKIHNIISYKTKEKKEKNLNLNENFVLKGDSLQSLSTLKEKLGKKVDVIYIDPPYYFTDKKSKDSFKYNSNFNLHTWIIFLENRLKIAKELLSDDGVIFISMNDEGGYHLKLICDQVFGIENHLTNIKWNKQNAQNDSEYFQENTENIFVYKKKDYVALKTLEETETKVIEKDGEYYIKKGGITKGGEDGFLNSSPNLGYTVYYNEKTGEVIPKMDYDKEKAKVSNDYSEIYEPEDQELLNKGFVAIRPPISKGRIKRWTWGIDLMKSDNDRLLFNKTVRTQETKYTIYTLKKVESKLVKNGVIKELKRKPPKNYINLSSSKGSTRINDLFQGQESFAYSKPVELMNELLSMLVDKKDITVMDFFAGSGSIGESVLMLNKEDGQKRKFILLEQMDYAKTLTFERLKKVINLEGLEETIQYAQLEETKMKKKLELLKTVKTVEEIMDVVNTIITKSQKEELLKISEEKIKQKDKISKMKQKILKEYISYDKLYVKTEN